jgi:hypothetical protein
MRRNEQLCQLISISQNPEHRKIFDLRVLQGFRPIFCPYFSKGIMRFLLGKKLYREKEHMKMRDFTFQQTTTAAY